MGVLMRRVVNVVGLAVSVAIAGCSDAIDPVLRSGADAAELQRVIDSSRIAMGIPGAVVVVRVTGGSEYVLTSGVENLASGSAMSFANRFRIGSITKTMIATVALQLVDEGAIALTDPISRLIPGSITNADRITIRMILNHTSGVPDYVDDPAVLASVRDNPGRTFTAAEAIAAANRQAPRFAPGAEGKWEFSNTNYILLGLVIESVTGMSIDQALQRRIFDRLGMSSTFFATTVVAPPPFSRGYSDLEGAPNADVTTLLSPTFAGAAGAVVSNARDLVVWSQALADGSLLSAARHADQLTPVLASSVEAYGLGAQKFGGWVGHSGEMAGFEASMYTRPGVGTIVVLINKSFGEGSPAFEIFDRVRWAEFGTR